MFIKNNFAWHNTFKSQLGDVRHSPKLKKKHFTNFPRILFPTYFFFQLRMSTKYFKAFIDNEHYFFNLF